MPILRTRYPKEFKAETVQLARLTPGCSSVSSPEGWTSLIGPCNIGQAGTNHIAKNVEFPLSRHATCGFGFDPPSRIDQS
jgi:hypothetical protein